MEILCRFYWSSLRDGSLDLKSCCEIALIGCNSIGGSRDCRIGNSFLGFCCRGRIGLLKKIGGGRLQLLLVPISHDSKPSKNLESHLV